MIMISTQFRIELNDNFSLCVRLFWTETQYNQTLWKWRTRKRTKEKERDRGWQRWRWSRPRRQWRWRRWRHKQLLRDFNQPEWGGGSVVTSDPLTLHKKFLLSFLSNPIYLTFTFIYLLKISWPHCLWGKFLLLILQSLREINVIKKIILSIFFRLSIAFSALFN